MDGKRLKKVGKKHARKHEQHEKQQNNTETEEKKFACNFSHLEFTSKSCDYGLDASTFYPFSL